MPTVNNAWSYSALSLYETCPKKFYHLRVLKDVKEATTEHKSYGDEIHLAIAKYLQGKTEKMPIHLAHLEKFVSPIKAATEKTKQQKGEILVEQKLAINAALEPTDWFAPDVFCRAIVDYGIIGEESALIIDWKTGKQHEDITQLQLMALMLFAFRPKLKTVRAEFWWTKTRRRSGEDFCAPHVPGLWAELLNRAKPVYTCHDTPKDAFRAKPSGLCKKYCPVTSCSYHGV